MKENNHEFWKELVEYVFHRARVVRLSMNTNIELSDYLELY